MEYISKHVVDIIRERGWLAISYLTFDNSINCNVFRCGGKVTYSTETNTFYWMQTMDTTDSMHIKNALISTDPKRIESISTIVESDIDCLQHVAYASYAYPSFFDAPNDEPIPYPSIPKPDELKAMTKDENTGLYSGAPWTITRYRSSDMLSEDKHEKLSAIPFYEKFDPSLFNLNSFALVESWKNWYDMHDKFITMIQAYFGIGGCV